MQGMQRNWKGGQSGGGEVKYSHPSKAERIAALAVKIAIVAFVVHSIWIVSSPERHRATILWFDSIVRGERGR